MIKKKGIFIAVSDTRKVMADSLKKNSGKKRLQIKNWRNYIRN